MANNNTITELHKKGGKKIPMKSKKLADVDAVEESSSPNGPGGKGNQGYGSSYDKDISSDEKFSKKKPTKGGKKVLKG